MKAGAFSRILDACSLSPEIFVVPIVSNLHRSLGKLAMIEVSTLIIMSRHQNVHLYSGTGALHVISCHLVFRVPK